MVTRYKDYTITEIFRYHLGRADYEVHKDGADYITAYPSTCLEDIRNDIDEKENELNPNNDEHNP